MTTINQARFKIDGTASEDPTTGDPGYVATHGQTLDCTLEISPSSALSVIYQVFNPADMASPLASYGSTNLTWVASGLPEQLLTNPNATAQIIMPASGVASYLIRCSATMADGVDVYERLVTLEATTSPTIRKTVPAETEQFRKRGWSDDQNRMVDAIAGGLGAFGAAGTYQGTWVTDAGGGTVNVAAGSGFLRTTASVNGVLKGITWGAALGVAITVDTARYVGVEYNAGSPQVVVRTANTFTGTNEFLLATVYNEGGTIHILEHEQATMDGLHGAYDRFFGNLPLSRDERTGGLIVGDTGTRNLTMSAGVLHDGLSRFTIAALDTSAASTFDYYYRDGGVGWTKVAAQAQYSNSHYDDNTGVLHALTGGNYGITWWYLESDGHVVGLYGQGDYASLAAAQGAVAPVTVPGRIGATGLLIGRTIVLQGAAAATEVDSVYTYDFDMAIVIDHNSLAGLQGGVAGQYYHLSLAQHTDLTDGGICTSHVHTLDQSYDATGAGAGRFITASDGAVAITAPDRANNVVLDLTQNDVTNNPTALKITNAGTGASIELSGTTKLIKSAANLTLQVDSKAYLCTDAGGQVSLGNSGRALLVSGDTISIEGLAAGGNVSLKLNANVAALRDLQIDAENANALGARITFSDSWQKDSAVAGGYSVAMPYGTTAAEWTTHKNDYTDGVSVLGSFAKAVVLAGRAGGQTVIGGTAATDGLVLRATSGVGVSGSDIVLQVGNNGATEAVRVLYDGRIGFGTATAPHGAVGYARWAFDGVDANAAGPHIQITTAVDDYPLVQLLNWGHDGVYWSLDAYYDGADKSSDAGSNFRFGKWTDRFHIQYESGIAQGAAVTWDNGIALSATGNIGLCTETWGTNAAKVLAMGSGTAPTTSPADAAQQWVADRGGTAGKAGLHLRSEDGTSHVISDRTGWGTTAPTVFCEWSAAGTVKTDVDFLAITNTANAADMDGTGTGILFNQWYYDAATPAIADAARVLVTTETDWTALANSQDAAMAFMTAHAGTVTEHARLTAHGNLLLGVKECDATAAKCLFLSNATAPSDHTDDGVFVYSSDSSDAAATLAIWTEQAVENDVITVSNRLKIKVNGAEYWIGLDAV